MSGSPTSSRRISQRLRLGRARPRGADRLPARDRCRRRAPPRAWSGPRRGYLRRRIAALHQPRHAGPHARARCVRGRRHSSRSRIRRSCSAAARCSSARSGRTDLLGRGARRDYARDDVRSLHESSSLTTITSRSIRPTAPGRCARPASRAPRQHDRLRAPPQPLLRVSDVEAFVDATAPRPAGGSALLRPDAPDEPGRSGAPRWAGPGAAAAVARGDRSATSAGALLLDLRPPAEHAVAHATGSQTSRSVRHSERGSAGSPSRPAARPGPAASGRLGRGDPTGTQDRCRGPDPRPSPRRDSGCGPTAADRWNRRAG